MTSVKKTGILLVNLGTPDQPESKSIKRYLSQFLHDKRVVDLPRIIWYPLLHGIILPTRAKRLSALYRSIWLENGSPLMVYSRLQQQALQTELPHLSIRFAMTYGNPNIENALLSLSDCEHIIILPLYPQYSSSTTAPVWDAVYRHYKTQRFIPKLTFIRDYATHPLYIRALIDSIEHAKTQYGDADAVLFSYHGMPERYIKEGDDYAKRCKLTTKQVVNAMNLPQTFLSYQSRFGKETWLTPYTDEMLRSLPKQGIKHLHVICPGFSVDCLETLEEINMRGRKIFLENGGESFHYIPALNASELQIELLKQLILDAI